MEISIPPGRYVVAVSGGVDSMVLLHLLARQPGHELVVAHFDHGIRQDSAQDRRLVEQTAQQLGLPFVYSDGHLGPGASEDVARRARYDFLFGVTLRHKASAIITAHHQDDLIETAFINLHRGTGRRGLTALGNRPGVLRPLLDIPKADIITYAKAHHIAWREDSTNNDEKYLRNYLRQHAVQKLSAPQRARLLEQLDRLRQVNHDLDQALIDYLAQEQAKDVLDRDRFKLLPTEIAGEIMAYWLRGQGIIGYDRKTITRLVRGAQTLSAGKQVEIVSDHKLLIGRHTLALHRADR